MVNNVILENLNYDAKAVKPFWRNTGIWQVKIQEF